MDIQFYGANCLAITHKSTKIIVDDNLESLGKKSVIKPGDVALYTSDKPESSPARLVFNGPGEYEVGDVSIVAIDATPFMNDDSGKMVTMYKLATNELSILVTGHILGDLSGSQLERIGQVDVLFVPVGNGGYTLDPIGALKLIKDIEPKIVVPTHYKEAGLKYPVGQTDLETAIKELAMEPKERVIKLKIKPAELTEMTQLVVLESI
jgi:L-ascorbate metabolism protein UlaG (beta-lactamase superfamily)